MDTKNIDGAILEALRILGFGVVIDDSGVTVGAKDQGAFDYLNSRDFPGAGFCNALRVPFLAVDKPS